eukprot:CCRYP_004618-RA/>CCRYP_004618-RA protein AED:0.41 eAED:0.41 QI:119/1/0.5/1/0/0/2/0/82
MEHSQDSPVEESTSRWHGLPANTEVQNPKQENTPEEDLNILEKGMNIPIVCRIYTMIVCIIWIGMQFHCLSILTIVSNIAHK